MYRLSAPALLVFGASLALAGCAAIQPRNALPEASAAQVDPDGFHNIRFWGDEAAPAVVSPRDDPAAGSSPRSGVHRRLNLLAISGGAEDGAFGAGLLAGWGDAGNRPDFDLVTGVSSGALIAPFAFLGRAHDAQLREIFTQYGRKDIFAYNVPSLLEGSALVDDSPLSRLIEKYIDRDFIREVAEEKEKGKGAPDRHHQSRRAAPRAMGHGAHCGQLQTGRDRVVPEGFACVGNAARCLCSGPHQGSRRRQGLR